MTERDPQIVRLNQPFSLFDPLRTDYIPVNMHYPPEYTGQLSTSVTLKMETIPEFSIDIFLINAFCLYSRGFALTPFNPEIGYTITSEDYNLEKRFKKLISQKEHWNQKLVNPLASHLLTIQESPDGLKALKTPNEYYLGHLTMDPEYVEELEKLRVLLSFPRGSYLAMPADSLPFSLLLQQFFPADSGPLAKDPRGKASRGLEFYLSKDMPILLPFDRPKLESITAKFVIES